MKLIVGLGNPGRKYEGTRHNMGFRVLAEVGRRHGAGRPRKKFQAESVEASVAGHKALLLRPQAYMNNSGVSVQTAVAFYKLELTDLLVVCDDFSLPLAGLRFRSKGSSGGQKGLGDIIRRLATEEFPRLRIGIGTPQNEMDPADFVLSRFSRQEIEAVDQVVIRAADAVADWAENGIDHCMNHYN